MPLGIAQQCPPANTYAGALLDRVQGVKIQRPGLTWGFDFAPKSENELQIKL